MHIIANVCSKLIFIMISIPTENLNWSYSKLLKSKQRDIDLKYLVSRRPLTTKQQKSLRSSKLSYKQWVMICGFVNDFIKAISIISIADDSNLEVGYLF